MMPTCCEKKKKQNSQEQRRVVCELHGAVSSLCSAVKSSAGVLCLILVISGKMWVIGSIFSVVLVNIIKSKRKQRWYILYFGSKHEVMYKQSQW